MEEKNSPEKAFTPAGTIVFMICLFILAAMIWFSVYDIQVDRHF